MTPGLIDLTSETSASTVRGFATVIRGALEADEHKAAQFDTRIAALQARIDDLQGERAVFTDRQAVRREQLAACMRRSRELFDESVAPDVAALATSVPTVTERAPMYADYRPPMDEPDHDLGDPDQTTETDQP